MANNKTIKKVLNLLDENYPKDIKCYLDHENPWQLLIATILSAQCTDDRVNIVTKDLFRKYTSVKDFAEADISELEQDVRSTGFYRNKAKNIIGCCRTLLEQHDGQVPEDIEKLVKLQGVGRKTANVIRGNIYNIPSIVVDTHVKRISKKLGFTEYTDPVKIEFHLMEILPKEHWIRYNTQVIAHGRAICTARSPKCERCFLLPYCKTGLENMINGIDE
ncbi:endonuclease III [Vallitalea sp.]|jgi:endonuclease-3|uniref:endonuclease III n=1 Tax=Vallitalea sp. TaxID=1882829 RepID=UPI0025F0FEC8|nr:endonuclease III [Vallitalea sp.]MCT4686175.1 endonuclease III [Vallitalea sp.]